MMNISRVVTNGSVTARVGVTEVDDSGLDRVAPDEIDEVIGGRVVADLDHPVSEVEAPTVTSQVGSSPCAACARVALCAYCFARPPGGVTSTRWCHWRGRSPLEMTRCCG